MIRYTMKLFAASGKPMFETDKAAFEEACVLAGRTTASLRSNTTYRFREFDENGYALVDVASEAPVSQRPSAAYSRALLKTLPEQHIEEYIHYGCLLRCEIENLEYVHEAENTLTDTQLLWAFASLATMPVKGPSERSALDQIRQILSGIYKKEDIL